MNENKQINFPKQRIYFYHIKMIIPENSKKNFKKRTQTKRLADPRKRNLYDKEHLEKIYTIYQAGLIDCKTNPFLMAQLHLFQIEREKSDSEQLAMASMTKTTKTCKIVVYILLALLVIGGILGSTIFTYQN